MLQCGANEGGRDRGAVRGRVPGEAEQVIAAVEIEPKRARQS